MLKKMLIVLCLLSFNLSGCTVDANRIYTICKEDYEASYCYDNSGKFFKVVDDSVVEITSVGLKDIPALTINPTDGNFQFKKQMPGLYKGTLESVNHYLYKVCSGNTSDIEITYRDWNNIEIYVHCQDFNARVIFNIRGDVRIYFIDSDKKPIEPLFL